MTVKKTEAAVVAFTGAKGAYSQIPGVLSRLYKWIREKGYLPSGPPSALYFNAPGQVPDDWLLWEVQVPLAGTVAMRRADDEGFGVKRREAVQVAWSLHQGRFETIHETYSALMTWITLSGFEVDGPAEEVYLTDPALVPPEGQCTEVRVPVRRR